MKCSYSSLSAAFNITSHDATEVCVLQPFHLSFSSREITHMTYTAGGPAEQLPLGEMEMLSSGNVDLLGMNKVPKSPLDI